MRIGCSSSALLSCLLFISSTFLLGSTRSILVVTDSSSVSTVIWVLQLPWAKPSRLQPETWSPSSHTSRFTFACWSSRTSAPSRSRVQSQYTPRFRQTGTLTRGFVLNDSIGQLTSASQNFMLHFLPPRTNSSFASPSTPDGAFDCGRHCRWLLRFQPTFSTPLLGLMPYTHGRSRIDCACDSSRCFFLSLLPRCCELVGSQHYEPIAFSTDARWIPFFNSTLESSFQLALPQFHHLVPCQVYHVRRLGMHHAIVLNFNFTASVISLLTM